MFRRESYQPVARRLVTPVSIGNARGLTVGIVHVVDASDEQSDLHRQVVNDTLRELDITGKPVITAFNKSDLAGSESDMHDKYADRVVSISAKTRENIEDLYQAIRDILKANREMIDEVIPYSEASRLAHIRKYGQVLEEEYTEEGIRVKGYL